MSAKCRIYLIPNRDKGLTDLFIKALFSYTNRIIFVNDSTKSDCEIDISQCNGAVDIRSEAQGSAGVCNGIADFNKKKKKNGH